MTNNNDVCEKYILLYIIVERSTLKVYDNAFGNGNFTSHYTCLSLRYVKGFLESHKNNRPYTISSSRL